MKYIVVLADGMADFPLAEIQNRTPLEVAKKPYTEDLLKKGKLGMVKTVPGGMTPASDVANLSVLGYNPKEYYTGRGPLEAANIGVDLDKDDVAFRCNLITEQNGILSDYSAGHITSKESKILMKYLDKELGSELLHFYPGTSYRNLLVVKRGSDDVKCYPPHDITGKPIDKYLPSGNGAKFLIKVMQDSKEILLKHQINKVRIDLGENPANMIWLWGQGKKPQIPLFSEKYGLTGAVISAVDLIKGLGRIIGLDPVDVPGATGYYDTNYQAKAEYALKTLETKDFIYIHVEAPDEAGHNGDLREKITAFERIDRIIVGKIVNSLKSRSVPFRILILPDHPTPVNIRTHVNKPVWFVLSGEGVSEDNFTYLSEAEAKKTSLFYKKGHELMNDFILKKHY